MSLSNVLTNKANVEPKILTLTKPSVRNQRTLIWLQHQTPTINWSKWDGIVTSLSDYYYWSAHNASIVGLIITHVPDRDSNDSISSQESLQESLQESSQEYIDNFLSDMFEVSKKISMIAVSHSIYSLKSNDYWVENYTNLLPLETAINEYPFLKVPWMNTPSDAVAMFAHLCRFNRLVDCSVTEERASVFKEVGITVHTNIIPEEIWVISQYFKHKNKERAKEIKECLALNCNNPYIDRVIQLTERDYSKEWVSLTGSTKIHQCVIGKRLTYAAFLQFVHDEVPPGVFVILCNADIYFGDSLMNLWKMNLRSKMLALLRWDDTSGTNRKTKEEHIAAMKNATIFGPRADSQDTWILFSDSIKDTVWNYNDFNFFLGYPGCDNAFAGLMFKNYYTISNPALSFKTYHIHNTEIRNYTKSDCIKTSLYINIVPCYIIDTEQRQTPDKFTCICNELVSFTVRSSSVSNVITYCTMLAKEDRYIWEPSIENNFFDPAIPVYTWKNCAVSVNGLVYNSYTIYTGKNADAYPYWADSNIDIFTPMSKQQRMFAIPMTMSFAKTVFSNPDIYILHYLSKCARLITEYPNTACWMPQEFEQYMTHLNLPVGLHKIYYTSNISCWADEVVGFVPSALEFGREDMGALRSLMPSWVSTPQQKVCCIVVDDTLTEKFVNTIIQTCFHIDNSQWTVKCVMQNNLEYDILSGASMCMFLGGKNCYSKWAKLWALPKHCCVVEFQQELQLDGEFQHMAHMCDFKSWVLLLSKGSVKDVQNQILSQLNKWLVKNASELII